MPCNPPLRLGALATALGALAAAPRTPVAQPHEDRAGHGLPATRAVVPAPATRAWFAAGEFVMGTDPAQMETGRALCANDLRRTAASYMASAGIPRLTISKVLNHVERTVTAVYDRHSYDPEKRVAMDWWAARLLAVVNDEERGNVLPFVGTR